MIYKCNVENTAALLFRHHVSSRSTSMNPKHNTIKISEKGSSLDALVLDLALRIETSGLSANQPGIRLNDSRRPPTPLPTIILNPGLSHFH